MRCPACGHENREGAKFCRGCGASFASACPKCGANLSPEDRFCDSCGHHIGQQAPAAIKAPDPRSYTPKHLAEKILTSRSALEGERKQVTVLFADVKGSMELSEQVDPEEWHKIMDRFFRILADGVHRFEGTVNEYRGDGLMALFGAPIAHEDHAARACYAVLSLQQDLRRYANELRVEKGISFSVRMGLNSGEVVVGRIGDDLRMDYTALGHTASLGARMEQIAAPDRANLTEHTAKLVEGLVQLEDLGKVTVKGVKEPLRVYELRGIGRLRTRLEVSHARGFTKFVGRRARWPFWRRRSSSAISGNAQVVGVVAEPGVGKSRLCYEFLERCRARGVTTFEAHGIPHGKSIPLLPMLDYLRTVVGIADQDSAEAARQKIAGSLLLLDESFREALPMMFEFLGVPDPDLSSPRMDPEARQRHLYTVIKRITQLRGQRAPVVTLFEDLHWFDGGSEALLEQLVEALPGTRLLRVVTFRPEYHARWMKKSYYQQLPLLPLGPEALAELLTDLLGTDPSLEGLGELIRERTSGNPFFVEEVVQSLAEGGSLAGSKGAYRLVKPIGGISIPPTVQAVLAARIDRLPEREKRVLQTASVIGKTFSEAVLARVIDLPEMDLTGALTSLTGAEFLYEEALYPQAEYAFKHRLTQEVAYQSQLSDRRSRTHAAVARTIAELEGTKLDEQAALLAYHWEQAGDALEAAGWHQRAAEWAGMNHPDEALRHWQSVRRLLGSVAESPAVLAQRAIACAQAMQVVMRAGSSPEELEELSREGTALAARTEAPHAVALVLHACGFLKAIRGQPDALDALRGAVRAADATEDAGLKAAVRYGLSFGYMFSRKLAWALACADEGLALVREDAQRGTARLGFSPYLLLLSNRGLALSNLGRLEEAARDLDHALDLARDRSQASIVGILHANRAVIFWLAGDVERALFHARQAVEHAGRSANKFQVVIAGLALGEALVGNKRWSEALDTLAKALELARTVQHVVAQPSCLALLSTAQLALGDVGVARAHAEEALRIARRHEVGLRGWMAAVALARALLESEGAAARDSIERLLNETLALSRESGAKTGEPFIHLERAEVASRLGDEAARERELREAHRLFLEIGAPIRAAEVAKELTS